MQVKTESIAIVTTTSSTGTSTSFSPCIDGTLAAVEWVPGTAYSGGTYVLRSTNGQQIWTTTGTTAATRFYPRAGAVSSANAAITNSHVPVVLCNERLKVNANATASTGGAKTATLRLYYHGVGG